MDPVEVSFRRESARLVAWLTARFGSDRLALAEDVAQEAFLRAMQSWRMHGVPPNPGAWLRSVARNIAIDRLRHDRRQVEWPEGYEPPSEAQVDEDETRLLFLCAHPAISEESRIALMLNAVAGLSAKEIARGLLSTEEAVSQRILRAKRTIRDSGIELTEPSNEALPGVLAAIYLAFNEGYLASTELTRSDLCDEAILMADRLHLTRVGSVPETAALLALMYFHSSRLPARSNELGDLVLWKDQDRSLWDQNRISEGFRYLSLAAWGNTMSRYHCEAALAAEHTKSEPDWAAILMHYDDLVRIAPGPVARLNRLVAVAEVLGPQQALSEFAALESRTWERHAIAHALRANLLSRTGDVQGAKRSYDTAISLCQEPAQIRFLQSQRASL